MKRNKQTIDAEGKILGRLATEIAVLLRGKNKPEFVENQDVGDTVIILNASKIKVSGKKADQKEYFRHTGYLGNQKIVSYEHMMQKNPSQIIRKAVYGMLPKNKLRDRQIKRLKIKV